MQKRREVSGCLHRDQTLSRLQVPGLPEVVKLVIAIITCTNMVMMVMMKMTNMVTIVENENGKDRKHQGKTKRDDVLYMLK